VLPNKFVILWDNQPVGLDRNSGGYPFKTNHPSQVEYWNSMKEAQTYVDTMQRGASYRFIHVQIVEIQFRIMSR